MSGSFTGSPVTVLGSSTPLTLIPEIAGHPYMGGPSSYYLGTISSGSDVNNVYDINISDSSGAQIYRGWKAYFPSTQETRFVQDVDLGVGKLSLNRSLTTFPGVGTTFFLTKDFSWEVFKEFCNEALRQMKHKVTYVQTTGVTGRVISVPTNIIPDNVLDVRFRESGNTLDPGNFSLAWYAFDYVNDVWVLRSDQNLDSYDLIWDVVEPYAAIDAFPLQDNNDSTAAPSDWLIAEATVLALSTLWANQVTDTDIRRVERRLGSAGRLVAGMRAKYKVSAGRRLMSSTPT